MMDNFWQGFSEQQEKVAIGIPLASLAGKATRAVSSVGKGTANLAASAVNYAKSVPSRVAAYPGKMGKAFQDARAGVTVAGKQAVKQPLAGVRRDVSNLLTGAGIGAAGIYLARGGGEQRKNPY